MGFLDKAKAAATDLAAKADTALASSGLGGPGGTPSGGGDADKLFRDLGVLAYLEANGRPADADERTRVMGTLRDLEQRGAIGSFALHTAPPPPPGAASAPPPPGASALPPQPAWGRPPAAAEPPAAPVAAPEAPSAPPPPPSWMTKDDT